MSVKELLLDLPAGKLKWLLVLLLPVLAATVTSWKADVDAIVKDYPAHKAATDTQLSEIKDAVKRVDQRTYDLALKAGVRSEPPAKEPVK